MTAERHAADGARNRYRSGPGDTGKDACRGDRACYDNPGPIAAGTCNGPPDPVTGKGVCDLAPVAWWTYDDCHEEGGRTLISDRSGNQLHGVASGGFRCVVGLHGKAGEFDGVDALVEVADHPLLHFTTGLTISALVKPSTIIGLHTIVNKWCALDSYGLFVVDGRYVFIVAFPDGIFGRWVVVGAPATPDEWARPDRGARGGWWERPCTRPPPAADRPRRP